LVRKESLKKGETIQVWVHVGECLAKVRREATRMAIDIELE
jgi:hypothetical protein